MYDEFYGLSGRPFQLTPDSRFWFDTATHKKAMAYLGYGLSQGEGFIVVTGDIGAGKTTLVGHLVDTVDPERLNVIRIVSTQIAADDLLHTVCAGLDVDATGMGKAQMLSAIERGLHMVARGGRRTLLIVDEAQALPVDSLEELRMLSNFQAGGYALLQIFLLGQPEFREKLGDSALEQLRQRVIAMHHLGPMEPDELEAYLVHRLSVVDWKGRPDFKVDALATIYAWSGGIPRRINQLVSRVLLHGAIEGIDTFDGADVMAVVGDLRDDGMAGGVIAEEPAEGDMPLAVKDTDSAQDLDEPSGDPLPAPDDAQGATMEWPFVDRGVEIATADVEPDENAEWRPIAVGAPIADAADTVPAAVRAIEADHAPLETAAIEANTAVDDALVTEPETINEARPAAISAPPRLFDRISLRGRRSVLAPVDPSPIAAEAAPDVEAEPVASADPVAAEDHAQAPKPSGEPAPVIDLDLARRLADIDRRLEDQDAALRRVLTLLVDWVEGGGARPDLGGQDFSGLRDRVG